jgi:rhodanese-related sulfurtransferase
MSEIRSVTPEEAKALIDQGHVYVDVRSEQEFEAGHPAGALNVPISHMGPAGMTPNADFVAVMTRAFGKSEALVVGCKAGGRSKRAVEALRAAGFANLCDMNAGWDGARDAFGRKLTGWREAGLPSETGSPAGQGYGDVKVREPR